MAKKIILEEVLKYYDEKIKKYIQDKDNTTNTTVTNIKMTYKKLSVAILAQ